MAVNTTLLLAILVSDVPCAEAAAAIMPANLSAEPTPVTERILLTTPESTNSVCPLFVNQGPEYPRTGLKPSGVHVAAFIISAHPSRPMPIGGSIGRRVGSFVGCVSNTSPEPASMVPCVPPMVNGTAVRVDWSGAEFLNLLKLWNLK